MTGTVATNGSALAAARMFYCDTLGGRQMRRTKLHDENDALCFSVGGELVTTGPAATNDRITLIVDDPVGIAARCWDAGFTVRVRESADATTIAVVDPFDLELELVSDRDQRMSRRRVQAHGREPLAIRRRSWDGRAVGERHIQR